MQELAARTLIPVSPAQSVSTGAPGSVADAVVEGMHRLGVGTAFGLIGGAIAPLADAIGRSKIRLVHCRHEAGAAFAALEASLVSERASVLFCTTGPGLLNALNGLHAARLDGGRVIVLSAITPAQRCGRGAFQETGPHTMPDCFAVGAPFHLAEVVEDVDALPEVLERLRCGLQRPEGFVAHLTMSTTLLTRTVQGAHVPVAPNERSGMPDIDPEDVQRCARTLLEERCALWLGFGARHAEAEIRRLVERLGLTVISTPRGKGIVSEHSPYFAGVTGFAGHPSVHRQLEAERPRSILVLGTRMGEFSSMWEPSLVPPDGFIHVDVDPSAFGVGYPSAPTHRIEAEIGAFVRALLERLPEGLRRSQVPQERTPTSPRSPSIPGCRVRPAVLMAAIQRAVLDRTDAIVLSEAGNSFAWTTRHLAFERARRYRLSTAWGSMGHAVSGVLGAALEHHDKAVAVAGDGAMLMHNELHTAVRHGVPAVWIILNDASYGMIEHGMRGSGYVPVGTQMPAVDFAAMARSMGAVGLRVGREEDLDAALERAMQERGPTVVDVLIDPEIAPPIGARVEGLRAQGVEANRFGGWS